jgi:subtilase family serine protease
VKIGPDLLVSAFTVPSTAGAGGAITVNDTIQNAGGGAAAASTMVFYLSSNASLDASDVELGSRLAASLAPGASQAGSTVLSVPPATPTGSYYVLAQADGTSSIAETTEWNNVRLGGPVQIGADLVISALTAPITAGAGAAIAISDTTRNQGGGSAPASATTFYLSSNLTLDAADALLGSRSVPPLGSGAAQTASTTLVVPADTRTGTYYVLAKADGASAIVETIETNNTRFSSAVRIGPDLLVSAMTVPTTIINAGTAIVIVETTRNQGAGDSAPSATLFYLSSNTVLDAADVLLGSRAIGPLAAGAAEAGSTTVTIPAGTAAGTYYILAQADGEAAVAETSETNNGRVGWVRVGP